MCTSKDSDSGSARFERKPNSPPLRVSTIRWMSLLRSMCARKIATPGICCSSRSSTDRVASANDRYEAAEAAAAASIARASTPTSSAMAGTGCSAVVCHHAASMRLVTFLEPGSGAVLAGEVRGDEVVAFSDGTVLDRLASGDRSPAGGQSFPLAGLELLAPVPRPRAIFGIGLNYRSHAAETRRAPPASPIVFMKLPTSSAPPTGPIRCPAVVRRLDYEGELAVVMGAGGEIAGYAVADDVPARDLQGREPQWTRAKGFDASCPWGPWI